MARGQTSDDAVWTKLEAMIKALDTKLDRISAKVDSLSQRTEEQLTCLDNKAAALGEGLMLLQEECRALKANTEPDKAAGEKEVSRNEDVLGGQQPISSDKQDLAETIDKQADNVAVRTAEAPVSDPALAHLSKLKYKEGQFRPGFPEGRRVYDDDEFLFVLRHCPHSMTFPQHLVTTPKSSSLPIWKSNPEGMSGIAYEISKRGRRKDSLYSHGGGIVDFTSVFLRS